MSIDEKLLDAATNAYAEISTQVNVGAVIAALEAYEAAKIAHELGESSLDIGIDFSGRTPLEALRNLLYWKNYKDKNGKDELYAGAQRKAWKIARETSNAEISAKDDANYSAGHNDGYDARKAEELIGNALRGTSDWLEALQEAVSDCKMHNEEYKRRTPEDKLKKWEAILQKYSAGVNAPMREAPQPDECRTMVDVGVFWEAYATLPHYLCPEHDRPCSDTFRKAMDAAIVKAPMREVSAPKHTGAFGETHQWQPIETAPLDEEVIVYSCLTGPAIRKWGEYKNYNCPKFTLWMPLPALPINEIEGGSADV